MSTTMPTPLEAASKWQADALEAIRSYQAATVKTVEAWNNAFAKMSGGTPAVPELPVELKTAFGDPTTLVESSFHFAGQVLDLNHKFAHELIEAQKAAVPTSAPVATPAPAATPGPVAKPGPVETPTSAVPSAPTRNVNSAGGDRKN